MLIWGEVLWVELGSCLKRYVMSEPSVFVSAILFGNRVFADIIMLKCLHLGRLKSDMIYKKGNF